MSFNESDVIIFRKKNYRKLIASFRRLSLDNDIAIVIDNDKILKINLIRLQMFYSRHSDECIRNPINEN